MIEPFVLSKKVSAKLCEGEERRRGSARRHTLLHINIIIVLLSLLGSTLSFPFIRGTAHTASKSNGSKSKSIFLLIFIRFSLSNVSNARSNRFPTLFKSVDDKIWLEYSNDLETSVEMEEKRIKETHRAFNTLKAFQRLSSQRTNLACFFSIQVIQMSIISSL